MLVADKKECDDPVGKFNIVYEKEEGIETREQCAKVCMGKSSMFALGTNDFGLIRCNDIGCRCLCEISASEDGTCNEIDNAGYILYKFIGTNN